MTQESQINADPDPQHRKLNRSPHLKRMWGEGEAGRGTLVEDSEGLLDEGTEEALVLEQNLPLVGGDVHVHTLPLCPAVRLPTAT
jgi:hypothetical protein